MSLDVAPIPLSRRFSWLTPRERTILRHMMDGLTAEQIADVEYVGLCTVRSQIRSVMQKLGVRSQVAAVALAYHQLWDTPDARRAAVGTLLAVSA